MVEDVTIEEARLNLYIKRRKSYIYDDNTKRPRCTCNWFLMSENVISSIADIEELTVSADGLRVDVKAKIDENSLQNLYKEKTLVSGCGGGVTGNIEGSLEIPFNQTAFKIKPETIYTEVKKFYQESELYNLTGCVHKAMIYLFDGTTVTAEGYRKAQRY